MYNIQFRNSVGTGLVVRHYRPSTSVTADSQCSAMEELPPIDQNMLYDFDYQVSMQAWL